MDKELNLVWIDLEMTGLVPESNRIIEIATLVTDPDLNLLAEGPVLAIHQPPKVLTAMDEWNQRQHSTSGLIERVRHSGVDEAEAERQSIVFLAQYVAPGCSPMCGNSICQDRRFLARYMPRLEAFFHYRNLDVSTLKELARRWKPQILNGLVKQDSHQAMADIRESLQELKYYRQHFIS